MCMNEKKISVPTPWGELTACIGGDPDNYPEIFVYLKRKNGTEIDLAVVTHNIEDNEIGAYLYGDTDTDDWTIKHTWSEEEIKCEEE